MYGRHQLPTVRATFPAPQCDTQMSTVSDMSTKRNLFLCLDAFGTIFTPRESIAAHYSGVARSFGVKVNEEQVMKGFKNGMLNNRPRTLI